MHDCALHKEIAISLDKEVFQPQLTVHKNNNDVPTKHNKNSNLNRSTHYSMDTEECLDTISCSKCDSSHVTNTNCHSTSTNNKEQISFGRKRQQFKYDYKKPYKRQGNKNYYCKTETLSQKKKHEASDFRYGNYHQYYGYRNQGTLDSRISCLKKEWLHAKDVLDIGCNAGHLTLSIARDFLPNSIIGMDIDEELVKMAKRNVRHYIDYGSSSDSDFPISLPLSYGPVAQSLDPKYRYSAGSFPFNVQFVQGNYILPSDEWIEWQESYFDTVLCFSLTKWIHLNWGDAGVKRLFHRVYSHLRPGGCFLLEAQAYQSYSKRKKITEEIFKHFNEIQFYPEMFNEYLLTEVGFKSCELVDTPAHSSKGFSRPIYLFIKGDECYSEIKPKHVLYKSDSESEYNYSDVEQLSD